MSDIRKAATERTTVRNPFIGISIGAWAVFGFMCAVGDFKWWAWMLWVPWLTFVTLAPAMWWWKNRRANAD